MRIARLWLVLLVLPAALVPALAQETETEAYQALQAGEYDKAKRLFRSELSSSDRQASMDVVHYGDIFLATGEYREGLEALSGFSDNAYVLHARGALHEAVGEFDLAESAYRASAQQEQDLWRNLLLVAELFTKTGRSYQAEELYDYIYRTYKNNELRTAEALGVAGIAAARKGEFRDANAAFRTAYQLEPKHIRNLYWWGDLFRQKYNDADAQRTFDEAIAANPHYANLYVGYARSVRSFARQEEMAKQALDKNPKSVEAMSILAGLNILDGLFGQALAQAEEALTINPNSIEALAHKATVHYLRGEQNLFDETEARALGVNSRSSEFYTQIAQNLELKFRYPAAVEFGQKAVETNRRDANAYAQLGTSLLRLGRADEARRYLDFSFDQDPFNMFVGNTLTLIDEYEDFALLESEHFNLLIHNSERDVLGPAILDEAETAYASLSPRYPYQPANKMLIEAYYDADDFAVRVAGVPHLGLLGVSFGDVLAINTPKGQAEGTYNWARTLWHELVHTLSIGLSEFKLPRWFAEGLAVYEEQVAKKEWGREMQLEFLMAYDQNKLLPLDQMDRGFTRPTYQGQVLMSYFHASRVVGFIVEQYGFDSIVEILNGFAAGKNDEQSIQDATGASLAEIDTAFRESLKAEYRSLAHVVEGMPNPFTEGQESMLERLTQSQGNDFLDALRAGYDALNSNNWDVAIRELEKAVEIYPNYTDPGNPHQGLAAAYRAKGDEEKLVEVLERYLSVSEHGMEEARELGQIYLSAGKNEEARRYLERSLYVAPYDREVYEQLADLYTDAGVHGKAASARLAILGLNPVDQAVAFFNYAQSLLLDQRPVQAKRAVLQSLEVAPGYQEAQELLLQIVDEGS